MMLQNIATPLRHLSCLFMPCLLWHAQLILRWCSAFAFNGTRILSCLVAEPT